VRSGRSWGQVRWIKSDGTRTATLNGAYAIVIFRPPDATATVEVERKAKRPRKSGTKRGAIKPELVMRMMILTPVSARRPRWRD